MGVVVRGADQPLCVFADELLAELRDPNGRSVVLLARIWEDKITRAIRNCGRTSSTCSES
jgi:hypothetical protein